MEDVTELIASGMGSDPLPKTLPSLFEPLESFLEEKRDKPAELNLTESDILALASQVGEELEAGGISETDIVDDLSFLENVVVKEAGDKDDDPLAFLVSGEQMEVDADGLNILDQNHVSTVDNYSEEDVSYSDEEMSDADSESSSESDGTEKTDEDEMEENKDDIEDDGVYGQVSFYDDEAASGNILNVNSLQSTKSKNGMKHKKSKKKLKADGESVSKLPKKKHRRKRKKLDDDNEETDDKVFKAASGAMRRKNIRSILSEKNMDKEMLSAQNEEFERQKRLMELKKSLLFESAAESAGPVASTVIATHSAGISTANEKDSQLKSLLQVAEEEAEKEAENKDRKQIDKEIVKIKKEIMDTSPPSDVITLSSDSENSDAFDDDDESDVVMVPSEGDADDDDDDDDGPEDINNGGSHINDTLNLPDTDGRVQVNIGHPAEDPDIFLAPQIAQAIKPHQIGGVRFLYDNLVESVERLRTTPGFGCILAHSMGLGKTIQLVSFIDIFLRCAGGKRVLCIVPINTLQNWLAEFNYWLPPAERLHPEDDMTQSRSFPLYIINDSMKTTSSRAAVVEKWKNSGGALVVGYEMFRLLSSKKAAPSRAKNRSRKAKQEVIDVEEEDKNKSLMIDMHSALVDPGPDLVMCDEGHRIKNSGAAISMALKSIKTRRRVVLTGYPLQNNLMEYWCMVDFVRPNFLGTKTEFSNMFERPIMNGQCVDSTALDKKLMRHRSYVLHNLLEGFVQRRGHTVLQVNLPPKVEHVLLVRLSPSQRRMYCEFMRSISESGLCSWANNNPLKAFAVGCKIWNHSDILYEVLTKHTADKDNDLDIDAADGAGARKKTISKAASSSSFASTDSMLSIRPSASSNSLASLASESGVDKNPITYDWAEPLVKDYVGGKLENSGKFTLMFSLLEECLAVGDKVLIFSQSLLTLNKIEEFLWKMKVPRKDMNENWQRNKTYFRLDGSTSAQDRERMINHFNDPESKVWAFLLSTKAGCLGINLIAANRVIVVDASWNPCHDCQAICRVYRFGQVKNSYVYRFITDNTLEKKIYDRQISKQGMSDRIVDDMNPENKLTRRQVENLLDFEDVEFPMLDFSNATNKCAQDSVMLNVLKKHGHWLTKHPFTHESLLIDRKELRLSKREKRLAKEGYARDKRMKLTNVRPPAAAFFNPLMGGLPYRMPYNHRYNYAAFQRGPAVRPIASVRPMVVANSHSREEKVKPFGLQPLRPGVSIHQVITTTDIVLPGTNTGTQAGANGNKIVAGEKIMVIKTPKGVYIRTDDGKMFAVKSKSGFGLEGITGASLATSSTATTTTLTSARGSQAFPGAGLSAAPGGKRSLFTIAGNKKGVPFAGLDRASTYESFASLSSLKPQFLKTGTTELRSMPADSPIPSLKLPLLSPMGVKNTSLAGLMASDDYTVENNKNNNTGTTQMAVKSKMPVTVLPSLAVRTPRPMPHIQSSAAASTSSGSRPIVVMPTKPVISMGPTHHRHRRSMAAESSSAISTRRNMAVDRKNGVRLFPDEKEQSSRRTGAHNIMDGAASGTISSTSMASIRQQALSYIEAQISSNFGRKQARSNPSTAQQTQRPQLDEEVVSRSSTDTARRTHPSTPTPTSDGDPNSLGQDQYEDTHALDRGLLGDNLRLSSQRTDPASVGQRYTSSAVPGDMGGKVIEEGRKAELQNTAYKFNTTSDPYPSDSDNHHLDSAQGMRPVQKPMSTYLDVNHEFMPFSSSPFSQSLSTSSNRLEDDLQEGSSVYDSSSSNSYQFGSSFGSGIQQSATSFPTGSNSLSFGYSSNFVDGESVNLPSFGPGYQNQPGFLQSKINKTFNLQSSGHLYPMDMSYSDLSSHNQQQKFSTSSSSSTSTTPTLQEHGLLSLDKRIPSPISNPRLASNTSDNINNFLAVSSSQPNNAHVGISHSASQGFRSGNYDVRESSSKFMPTTDDSNGSNSLGHSSFSMTPAGRFSPAVFNHSLGNDNMRDNVLKPHQGTSSLGMPSKPQSFRPRRENDNSQAGDSSRLDYNSNMGLFGSQSMQEANESEYGNSSEYQTYRAHSSGELRPFSSPTMMSSSDKLRYSQASLGYPSLSPLMTGTSSPQPAPNDDRSVWPSVSPSVMERDYNYSSHSSNIDFPTGLHNPNFNHFIPDPENNL
ncbi:hypothetical protein BsWGS_13379 [Bradybaena similaris]